MALSFFECAILTKGDRKKLFIGLVCDALFDYLLLLCGCYCSTCTLTDVNNVLGTLVLAVPVYRLRSHPNRDSAFFSNLRDSDDCKRHDFSKYRTILRVMYYARSILAIHKSSRDYSQGV